MLRSGQPISFTPDWHERYTASEMEKEFVGFEFKGPGWYLLKEQTMLVIPVARPLDELWNQKRDGMWSEKFDIYMYDGWSPGEIFASIARAPTRVDQR